MNLFGLSITRAEQKSTAVAPMTPDSWGWRPVMEAFAGAWQRNVVVNRTEVLAFSAVFACVSLIAADISKNRVKLVERDDEGIWTEITSPAFSPVLNKPNHYQNRIKFFESWMLSKLIHGNAYILKERDQRGVVVAMYVLDPMRCRPLVAPDGSVFYQLGNDPLSGVDGTGEAVPASEIIHDLMCAMFHPLSGISPIYACGLAATQGLNIQNHSSRFFANSARPGGVLTAPGLINQVTADRIKETWEKNFTGENVGRVAVLGDGLKFESLSMTAESAQMIEQLKMSVETVCSAFHVPGFLIGAAAVPPHGNIEALWQLYYIQCLQSHIESIELCLDEGLGLTDVPGKTYGTEFDIANLLRMDTATAIKVATDGVAGSVFTPDEARARFDLPKLPGGNTIYMQQQNYSLAALSKRDAKDDPFATATKPGASSTPAGAPETAPAVQVDPAADKDFELSDEDVSDIITMSLKAELGPADRFFLKGFDPGEPRDDHGQWTDGGGGGAGSVGSDAGNGNGTAASERHLEAWFKGTSNERSPDSLRKSDEFATALSSLPNVEGTVYRGARLTPTAVKSIAEGSVYNFTKSSSSTIDPKVADAFAAGLGVGGGDGRVKVIFEIKRSGAKDVTEIAKKYGRDEGEAIILKGASYKVTSVKSRHTVSGTKVRVVMEPP